MKTTRCVALTVLVVGFVHLVTPARANAEIVRVTFAGVMDFSGIGGSASVPYSGGFLYDTAIPPFNSGCQNGICYAHYDMTVVAFQMFGISLAPTVASVLIQDNNGSPVFNDFFTLTLLFGTNGVVVPGTNRIMDAVGVNATAFPATMFSSTAFPRSLDVFRASTRMNDYAQLRGGQLLVTQVPPAISNVVFSPFASAAPVNFQASASGNLVNMSWSAPSSGAPPTGYTVLARTPGGQLLATVAVGNVTTFSVAAPDGVYVLSVRATSATGAGPESNTVTVTVPQAVVPPGAPTNLAVTVSGTTAHFSWALATTGGVATSHLLVAGTSAGFAIPIASVSLPGTPGTTIPNIPPGTYYVRMLAVNVAGTSGPSNEVTVIVASPTLPGAPTLNPAVVSAGTVSLSWVPGSGGAPTSYVLTAAASASGVAIATVPVTGTSATFTQVPPGTYYLRLAAVNAVGTGPPSNEITVVVP
jgi:hypothetical protein